MTEVETDFVLYCGNCNLMYRPDERTHIDPWENCPRCGAPIHRDYKMSTGAGGVGDEAK